MHDPRCTKHIGWSDDGFAVRIKSLAGLDWVLQKQFSRLRYESFIRYLNMYGFRKRYKVDEFYRPGFHKDNPDSVKVIVGKKQDVLLLRLQSLNKNTEAMLQTRLDDLRGLRARQEACIVKLEHLADMIK